MNIFEQLNALLEEAKGNSKKNISDIPIHPEMETKEQGEIAAAEKILKLFQRLKMGNSGGQVQVNDSRPEIPDDMIDPMMKEMPKAIKDKNFDKNKVVSWDEESDEKIEKEVEIDNQNKDENDDYDDFDYRNNPFGDEEDDGDNSELDEDDDRSEDEKLKDAIDNAIDSLDDEDDEDDVDDEDDSGANWNLPEDEDEGNPGGQQGGQQGGKRGGEDDGGYPGSKKGGQQGGQDGGYPGSQGGQQGNQQGGGVSTDGGRSNETLSKKKQRLEDLKKTLDSKKLQDFNDKVDEIKNTKDIPNTNEIPGSQIDVPSDEIFKKDMKKAGFDDKSIEKMTKEKNLDTNYTDEEFKEIKKEVTKGLDEQNKKKGGSVLSNNIKKHAVKQVINDIEWESMIEKFLSFRTNYAGISTETHEEIKIGGKNHSWRKSYPPTIHDDEGSKIQHIYCFIDFTGSVQEKLVYTFLGKVVDLCERLEYTDVEIFGFGERVTEIPCIINGSDLISKEKKEIAVSQVYSKISDQKPGPNGERLELVAQKINQLKKENDDSIILIFGDGLWSTTQYLIELKSKSYLNDICVLLYYDSQKSQLIETINTLIDVVGIPPRNIITTKAERLI